MSFPSKTENGIALPSPPFIHVAGILNFRELGGYAILQSPSTHSVRRNLIYRCGDTSRVTPDGIATLRVLGITHVYDLRSNSEVEKNRRAGRGEFVPWEECKNISIPVFADKDYSPENIAIRYKDYASSGTEVMMPSSVTYNC